MQDRLFAKFGRFLLSHLLLFILVAMILTVIGILVIGSRSSFSGLVGSTWQTARL